MIIFFVSSCFSASNYVIVKMDKSSHVQIPLPPLSSVETISKAKGETWLQKGTASGNVDRVYEKFNTILFKKGWSCKYKIVLKNKGKDKILSKWSNGLDNILLLIQYKSLGKSEFLWGLESDDKNKR